MPTQQQIADHLDIDQSAVSRHMDRLNLDWKTATLDQIRLAYLRQLRGQAAGHISQDGLDLTRERALTEQVERELKQLTLAEKRGQLINVTQLEPALQQAFSAFRTELMSRDDKLKDELDALYDIDVDRSIIEEHTRAALEHLARYDPSGVGADPSGDEADRPADQDDDDAVGEDVSVSVGQVIG